MLGARGPGRRASIHGRRLAFLGGRAVDDPGAADSQTELVRFQLQILAVAAAFLLRAKPEAAVRGLCADLSSLVRGVGFRAADGGLSCITGIGSDAWRRLFGAPRPKELHLFREIRGLPPARIDSCLGCSMSAILRSSFLRRAAALVLAFASISFTLLKVWAIGVAGGSFFIFDQ